ncbi:MAG: 16S rRNA (adenine(1518)-N(6)/adenine(1519)-N(6))-dimethyltransferase RsmA [Patescibacteria group bacterium]|jgi:16S rRNA (adenine1518-N6/adenine1519-N6)-dimethyltransferase
MQKSLKEVRQLCAQNAITADKRRGQHFLVDDTVYEDILGSAGVTARDAVLEVGPGLGTLTARLAERAGSVTAIEIDARLFRVLQERFSKTENIKLVHGDVLAHSVAAHGITQPYKIVANIPYNITAAILKKFLADDLRPKSMTLLVQREVGERVVATPGTLSLLGLSVQLYAKARIVRQVSRECFTPQPAVDSVLLQIDTVHSFPYKDVTEKFFWRVVKIGFSKKRKQLHNNLTGGLLLKRETIDAAFVAAKISAKARAQELSVKSWHDLACYLSTIEKEHKVR